MQARVRDALLVPADTAGTSRTGRARGMIWLMAHVCPSQRGAGRALGTKAESPACGLARLCSAAVRSDTQAVLWHTPYTGGDPIEYRCEYRSFSGACQAVAHHTVRMSRPHCGQAPASQSGRSGCDRRLCLVYAVGIRCDCGGTGSAGRIALCHACQPHEATLPLQAAHTCVSRRCRAVDGAGWQAKLRARLTTDHADGSCRRSMPRRGMPAESGTA